MSQYNEQIAIPAIAMQGVAQTIQTMMKDKRLEESVFLVNIETIENSEIKKYIHVQRIPTGGVLIFFIDR